MSTSAWQVQIQGWASDLEHLARHFTATRYRVVKDDRGDGFLYESDAFGNCATSEDVLKVADEELCVLSGVLKLVRDSPEPLRTGAVYRQNATGERDAFVHIHATLHARAELGEITVTVTDSAGNVVTQHAPPPRTVAVSQLASTNEAVAKAMRLLAAPDHKSWVGMYRIHEVIEADLGGEHTLKKRGWGSARDLKRFKHSANSVKVAGDSARHGKEVDRPPTNPMSIDEAAAYLNYVLQSWLASKGA
jgi:hypothetical protein